MKQLADELNWIKFSGFSWTKDSMGFFYSRFDAPEKTEEKYTGELKCNLVYYHKIGTNQSDDQLIVAGSENGYLNNIDVSEDGSLAILTSTKDAGNENLL